MKAIKYLQYYSENSLIYLHLTHHPGGLCIILWVLMTRIFCKMFQDAVVQFIKKIWGMVFLLSLPDFFLFLVQVPNNHKHKLQPANLTVSFQTKTKDKNWISFWATIFDMYFALCKKKLNLERQYNYKEVIL